MNRLMVAAASAALLFACGDDSEGDATTTGPGTTTDPSTTTDASSSSTTDDSTSTSTSSGSSSSDGSSSGGMPEFYTPCEDNEECDATLICNTLSGFCTIPCEEGDTSMCVPPPDGDATPTCSMTSQTCVLSCFDGETCPEGMTCEGNDVAAFCQA